MNEYFSTDHPEKLYELLKDGVSWEKTIKGTETSMISEFFIETLKDSYPIFNNTYCVDDYKDMSIATVYNKMYYQAVKLRKSIKTKKIDRA